MTSLAHAPSGPAPGWELEPGVVAGLGALALAYWLLARRLLRRTGRVDGRAAAAFGGGLVALGAALLSPLNGGGSARSGAAHMLQHELVMMVSAPLLLLGWYTRLGVPVTRPLLGRALRAPGPRALTERLFDPRVALAGAVALVWAWHLPSLYDRALHDELWHGAQHASFLAAGVAFWLPVVSCVPGLVRLSRPARLAYLAAGQASLAVVAAALLFGPAPLYEWYAHVANPWGWSAVADQRVAGSVMMVFDMVAALAGAVTIGAQALARDERLLPAALERGAGDGRPNANFT